MDVDKKSYRVADGINWINGDPVPVDHIVKLTDQEARRDIGLDRIKLHRPRKTQVKPTEGDQPNG